MRNFDFSPLYRSAIGFDRIANIMDTLTSSDQTQPGFPPYNIELQGENKYRITMAVAGFERSELDIKVELNKLTVTGKKSENNDQREYLYRGIAGRNFERCFQLADHVQVKDAKLESGLLHIDLTREIPEAMKPRAVEINDGNLLESKTQKVA